MRKVLYCPNCRTYPNDVVFLASKPAEEYFRWNGEYYANNGDNNRDIKILKFCGKCGTRLEVK